MPIENVSSNPIYAEAQDSIELGFLTSTGRFVNRNEACDIALQAKQIKETKVEHVLNSFDLWPELLGTP